MPLLVRRKGGLERGGAAEARIARGLYETAERREPLPGMRSAAFFPTCANPRCQSSWLRLWRSRSAPMFEKGWCCSPECTRALVEAALSRELAREWAARGMSSRTGKAENYRHRIPLGLAMLEKGWIGPEDLRRAVEGQRGAGGRLGQWLMRSGGVSEARLTRALAMQWSCPVLGLEWHDPEAMAPLVPRLFVDALGCLPLRVVAQRILYLGFEDRPDPVLAVALERMTGLRLESGVMESSLFLPAHARALNAGFAPVELLEAASESALARALTGAIEKAQPVETRLVRVHEFLWLRMWIRRQAGVLPRRHEVRDLVCALARQGFGE